ncbi:MAG: iron ABC transporter permease [Chloroflexi bacterium]|nr:iron ABC transporter permease [Chloroflexota bacterium]
MSGPLSPWLRQQAGAMFLRVPLFYWVVFFLYPLLAIVGLSFLSEGQLDFTAFQRIISRAYYRERLLFTFGQAALSTLLTLLLALPAAQVMATYDFRGKTVLLALATLPFVLPTVVVAAAFKALLGDLGLVNRWLMHVLPLTEHPLPFERSLALILLTHVFYNYAIALHILSGYWRTQSMRIEEAARSLGCSPWRLWWQVRLPLLRPALFSAAALIFVFCFTSFGVVLLLGDVQHATLEVAIYRQVNIDLPTAAALSLTQSGLLFLLVWLHSRWSQADLHTPALQSSTSRSRPPQNTLEKVWLRSHVAIATVLVGAPLLALGWRSLSHAAGSLTPEHYINLTQIHQGSLLFVSPLTTIANSLRFALITTCFAVILGTMTAYWLAQRRKKRRRFPHLQHALFMMPLTTSAVTLGFGFTVVFASASTPEWFRALRGSVILIPILHTLVAFPFVLRCVYPALKAIAPSLREAAATLGAAPAQRWYRLELPLLSHGLFIGAIFAFVLSLGEFGASIFVIRPQQPTLPIAIFRLLSQPQPANFGMALALSVILLAICAAAFASLNLLRNSAPGEIRW